MNLETRTAQILAVTEQERDEVDERNPIVHAETGINRFELMSVFFTDEDGVSVERDVDLNEFTVKYFNNDGETVVEEGALYEWAIELFEERY